VLKTSKYKPGSRKSIQHLFNSKQNIHLLFNIIDGIVHHDNTKIVKGMSLLSELFYLPTQMEALLAFQVVLLGRVKDKKSKQVDKKRGAIVDKNKKHADLGPHEKALRQFGNAFKIDDTVLDGLIGIATRDFGPVTRLLPRFGRRIDESKIQKFVSLLENLRTLDPSGGEGFHPVLAGKMQSTDASGAAQSPDQQVQQAMGQLSYGDLFDIFDQDQSGQLDYSEFTSLLKFLNLNLPRQRAMRLFNSCAGADGTIDKYEFESCMRVLEELVTERVLSEYGYAAPALIKKFLVAFLILALLFIFIFLGINAFSTNSSFQSVVNSSFPALAAGGVGGGAAGGSDTSGASSDQEATVKQVMQQLNSSV